MTITITGLVADNNSINLVADNNFSAPIPRTGSAALSAYPDE